MLEGRNTNEEKGREEIEVESIWKRKEERADLISGEELGKDGI